MKHHVLRLSALALFILAGSGLWASAVLASWEQEFSDGLDRVLQLEKTEVLEATEGIGDTPSSKELLEVSIRNAVAQNGSGCQTMKMAVDRDFNPYLVLTSIFATGKVSPDELFVCSTEEGISPAVIAQAARDATLPDGSVAFTPDEITQLAWLTEGLPYTPVAEGAPFPPGPPPTIPPVSPHGP